MVQPVKLTCVVDNIALPNSGLRFEHGLAFLIEVQSGNILFDTGATFDALSHNLKALGANITDLDAIVFSHAHRDHTGGLKCLLERCTRPPVYVAHNDFLTPRFSSKGGYRREIGLLLTLEELERLAKLCISPDPRQVLPHIWTTGMIRRRPYWEGRSPDHYLCLSEQLVHDPYRDDMSLVIEGAHGLVVVCGCAHAGILNILEHVQCTFGQPPTAIIGGMHLTHCDASQLAQLVDALRRAGAPAIWPNHCTGQRALATLAQALPNRVFPCPAGTRLEL